MIQCEQREEKFKHDFFTQCEKNFDCCLFIQESDFIWKSRFVSFFFPFWHQFPVIDKRVSTKIRAKRRLVFGLFIADGCHNVSFLSGF